MLTKRIFKFKQTVRNEIHSGNLSLRFRLLELFSGDKKVL